MEEWRDIPGHEGKYQASTLGRIRSIAHQIEVIRKTSAPYMQTVCGKVLRQIDKQRPPYYVVQLGSKVHPAHVHVLVASAFLGPRPKGLVIRHLDGDSRNNEISNLCYGTQAENIEDACKVGTFGKVSGEQVIEIRRRAELGEPMKSLAAAFGISPEMAWKIATRRAYKWV